jgi:ABC-type Fe3+ transport system permease subunit
MAEEPPGIPEPVPADKGSPRTSRLATASLVCSVGAICLPVLLALLTALISLILDSSRATRSEHHGTLYAVATCFIQFVLFGGLAAGIALGIAALIDISRSKQSLKGRGLAIAGIAVGLIIPLMLPLLGLIIIFRDQAYTLLRGR